MPIYQCLVPADSLDTDRRTELAEAITTVHTSVTGAPRAFVHVVFSEYEPSKFFTAGRPNTLSVINGAIRAGRDRAARAELLTRLSEAWTAITGQHPRSVVIGLNELDSTSVMEAGLIMPAPGEEAAWVERHKEELGQVLSST
ncbi:tautomerase family protein [Streptomyces caniscabiei]|uniref:tautomerase family protein n=1 Tax=Streptomyces caniscabiei TaxID=2746961 RepID=UPI0007661A6B|nr:tautomerase family protein [Streptomyces caniscabiei]